MLFRCGVVLGKDGGMIKQLYLPFFLGMGGPILPGHQFLPWIHIEDITRLIMFSIEDERIRGILNGVAPHVISNKEFTNVSNNKLNYYDNIMSYLIKNVAMAIPVILLSIVSRRYLIAINKTFHLFYK